MTVNVGKCPFLILLYLFLITRQQDIMPISACLHFTIEHCRSLPNTAVHYQKLPFTINNCRSLQNTAIHYQTLPFGTIKHCRSLSKIAVHYQTVSFTIKHCRSLSKLPLTIKKKLAQAVARAKRGSRLVINKK